MHQRRLKILISGGGTGGHIFPAIAIGDAIKQKEPGAEILFIGARGRMEMEKVPMAGYNIESLRISGFQRNLSLRNLLFPLKLVLSIIKAGKIIRRFQPDVAVGTGGYASGPVIRMAGKKNIPTLIQEQNSWPGVTNRILGRTADRICVAFEGMEKHFPASRLVITGNPVRKDISNLKEKKKEALEFFKLEPGIPVVLVFGGSQGAKAINEAILNHLEEFEGENMQVIWQTGKLFYERAAEGIRSRCIEKTRVYDFINRMDLAYSAADVVVSRAGAIAISEICTAGIPAVFVPLPTAAEDHQTKNAMALVSKEAALIADNDKADELLPKKIRELISNENLREKFKKNMTSFVHAGASEKIAEEVLKLVKRD